MSRIAFMVVAVLVVIYLGDTLTVWLPLPPRRQQYGSVQIRRYYAMPLKGGRTEYGDAGTEQETCVRALFPHFGMRPCWYAARHNEKWITE
jgi:hypothetical protein